MSDENEQRNSYGLSDTHRSLLNARGDERRTNEYWTSFASKYRVTLKKWALRSGVQEATAEDIASNAEIKIFKAIANDKFDKELGRFRDWIHKIVQHETIDFFRRASRETELLKRYASEVTEEDPSSELERFVMRDFQESLIIEARKRVRKAVKNDPTERDAKEDTKWEIFMLATELGESPSELAKKYDKTEENIRQIIHRTRELLQSTLQKLEDEGVEF